VLLTARTIGAIASLLSLICFQAVLFGVKLHDPLTLVTVNIFFMAIAMLVAYFPAYHEASIQPMEALRAE
jgi:ABC-type antimicrobial peptide transport system permease subunit